jgi:hypothetical protein
VNTGNGSDSRNRQLGRAPRSRRRFRPRKSDFDAAGHYSRPDVFQLIVNEKPMVAVVAKG